MGKPLPALEVAAPEPPKRGLPRTRCKRGEPDRRPEHLRMNSWQPGVSGNPAGGPKGERMYAKAGKKLIEYLTDHPEHYDAIIKRWVKDAINGVPGARESLFDRADGKVFALPAVGEGEVQAVRITTVEIVAQAEPGEKMIPYRQVVIDSPAKEEAAS